MNRVQIIAENFGKLKIDIDVSMSRTAMIECLEKLGYEEYGGYLDADANETDNSSRMIISYRKILQHSVTSEHCQQDDPSVDVVKSVSDVSDDDCNIPSEMSSLMKDLLSALQKEQSNSSELQLEADSQRV